MKDRKKELEDPDLELSTEADVEDLRGDAEPFVKKIARISAFLYLGLAILVVAVAAIGIFSISFDDPKLPATSFPQQHLNVNSVPARDDRPVNHDVSGVTADVSEPDESKDDESTPPQKPTFCRPVDGRIAKGFSMDALVFSATMKDYRVHPGIDVAAPAGTEVAAFADGTVKAVKEDYFYGTTVEITHADGMTSSYMNLDPTLADGIKAGAPVAAGQIIGKIGNSARIEGSDEPHLHFELRVNGALIDPSNELPPQ